VIARWAPFRGFRVRVKGSGLQMLLPDLSRAPCLRLDSEYWVRHAPVRVQKGPTSAYTEWYPCGEDVFDGLKST
jgi:hypothetical protein